MIVAIYVLRFVIPLLFFGCLLVANKESDRREALGDSGRSQYMSQIGIFYRMHRRVSCSEFRQRKLSVGLITTIVAVWFSRNLDFWWILLIGLGAFIIGFYALEFYFWAENQDDQRKMLKDIHSIYDTLRVYLAVDVFITDSLEECYRRVANKRLKTAIYELKEGLRSQSEQLQEIESFRLKFDNSHINQLANLLSQYYRSGNVEAMIEDLSEQMVAIDHAINLRSKERMEMKGLIKEVMVLLGMLGGIAIALLGSISEMMESVL